MDPIRVVLFGGTFDPFHAGHLACARAAAAQLDAQLWLVPAYSPPHKSGRDDGYAHRLAMCAQVAAAEGWTCCDVERTLPAPSFTWRTVDHLMRDWPAVSEWYWLVGADSAAKVPRWRRADWLLSHVRFAVCGRDGVEAGEAAERLVAAGGHAVPLHTAERTDCASTTLRTLFDDALVPEAVAVYARRHPGLYAPGRP